MSRPKCQTHKIQSSLARVEVAKKHFGRGQLVPQLTRFSAIKASHFRRFDSSNGAIVLNSTYSLKNEIRNYGKNAQNLDISHYLHQFSPFAWCIQVQVY
jgi:hypothetical protein